MTIAPPDPTLLQACADAINNGQLPPVRLFNADPVGSPSHDYAFMCHPDVPAPIEGDLLYIPAAALENRVIVQVTQIARAPATREARGNAPRQGALHRQTVQARAWREKVHAEGPLRRVRQDLL